MAVVFERPKSLTQAEFHYCPGCTHGIIHRLVAEAIDKLGIEGVHYNVVDGKVVLTDRFDEWWSKFWETFNGLDANFVDKSILMLPQAWESFELAQKYYAEDVDVVLPDELLPYYDAVMSLYNEYSTAIILGQRPVDDYDQFIAEYWQNGGEQLAEYLATVIK